MDSKNVVELAQFNAKPGVSDMEVAAASQEAQDRFFTGYKGLISRELLKSESAWFVILHWETIEDAQRAVVDFMKHPGTERFRGILDPASLKITHLDVVEKY